METNITVKQAEENERKIVKFSNIDKESFTHSFRGISITVKAGESYSCRQPEGDHLATHLARKIIARAKKAGGADKDPKGSILWTQEEIDALKDKIIQEIGTDSPETATPEQQRKQDLQQIEKKFKPDDVSKADIIKDLKQKGIQPDVNLSKEELLKKLMEVESQGK